MLQAVLSGFILAIFAPWLYRLAGKATGWILALLPLGLFIYFVTLANQVSHGHPIAEFHAWVPSLTVNLSFYADGLSLLFALIITGVGTLIFIYGGGYLTGHSEIDRFYVYLLMFMASMLGVVLSDNVITLFVFWELTSVSSYMLIGYYHEKEDSRFAALQALLVTGAGGLAMLAGLILMALVGGSWEITGLFSQSETIQSSGVYGLILVLILAGAFTKSAQFPFHFWLPGAMAAPAPVSAYLHSATMVKAGVYLLARFSPILGGTTAWHNTLIIFGAVTMLLAAYIAWQQTDLKRILAYSTVSALGTLVLLLGIGTEAASEAAIVFLVVHSLYKGSLFMVAGAVDHETGTRFIDKLGGLRRVMPITAMAAILAALSMSGIPLFLGFIGKELIYEATLESGTDLVAYLIVGVEILANALTIIAAGLVAIRPFFGPKVETPKHAHEAPPSMWLGPITLASLGLFLGFFSIDSIKKFLPVTFDELIVSPAVSGVLDETMHVHLHMFPTSLSIVFMLSLLTLALGIVGYFFRDTLYRILHPADIISRWGPEQWYRWILDGTMAFARFQTRVFQSGYLRYYLLIIIITTVSLTGYTLFTKGNTNLAPIWRPLDSNIYEILIYITIFAATIMVVTTPSRLAAVAALGVVGYGMALLFILFGAPDLAMTQFSIETLSVILLVLVLYRLPRFMIISNMPSKLRDAGVAIITGGLMTALVLIVTALPAASRLTPYFGENSYHLAKGHNVVNVILVDFRGFDTMGEITVLSIAAIGVYGLLKLRMEKKHPDHDKLKSPAITDVYPAVQDKSR